MRILALSALSLALFHLPAPALAASLHVPNDHASIALALAASQDGDEIVVGPGEWTNRSYSPDQSAFSHGHIGHSITIRSEAGPAATILAAGRPGIARNVAFYSGSGSLDITLEGFTFRGSGDNVLFMEHTGALTLRRCHITDNAVGEGTREGGRRLDWSSVLIYAPDTDLRFEDCLLRDNTPNHPRWEPTVFATLIHARSVVSRDTRFESHEMFPGYGYGFFAQITVGSLQQQPELITFENCDFLDNSWHTRADRVEFVGTRIANSRVFLNSPVVRVIGCTWEENFSRDIEVRGGIVDVVIRHCTVAAAGSFLEVRADGGRLILENNVFRKFAAPGHNSGKVCQILPGTGQTLSDIQIRNNTFLGAPGANRHAVLELRAANTGTLGGVVERNLFVGHAGQTDPCVVGDTPGADGVTFRCNGFWDNDLDFDGLANAEGNLFLDPLFCPDGYSLQDGSPYAPEAGECGLVGVRGTRCAARTGQATALETKSWGAVKAGYHAGVSATR